MEYADGGTLRDYLKRNFDSLTWDDKYNLACQLTSAVLCLHDEGIAHRDLVFTFVLMYDLNNECNIYNKLFHVIYLIIALQ